MHFAIASAIQIIMLRAFDFFEILFFKAATSFISHITIVVVHSVITNLIVYIFFSTIFSFICELNSRIWHRVKKDLYLYIFQQRAWLYITLTNEKKLIIENLMIMNIRIDELNLSSDYSWKSWFDGIWMLKNKFFDKIDQTVTKMNVFFNMNVVDSRLQWIFMRFWLQFNVQSKISITKLNIFRDRIKLRSNV